MAPDKTDRREFLKFLGASATAAGLSHFCFLNIGSAAGPMAPDLPCQPPVEPDVCRPNIGDPDECIVPAGDTDYKCPETQADQCVGSNDPDLCAPPHSPDVCIPPDDPDECLRPEDPDECLVSLGDTDYKCPEPQADQCVGTNDPDLCAPPYSPDVCIPPADPDECSPPADPDEPPLAVTLTSFNAQPRSDHVLVSWETVTEINNVGFNLYRSTTPAASGSLLAFVPSQAPGGTAGASYTYADHDVLPGNTTYYWLEDVEFGGASSLHGPVSATVLAPTAVKLNRLSAAAAPARRDAAALLVSLLGGMALTAAGLAGRTQADADEQA